MSGEQLMALLREAHREPVDEAHYAAVRARVMAAIEPRRAPWLAWVSVAATLAAILLSAVGLRTDRRPVARLHLTAPVASIPPAELRASAPRPRAPRRSRPLTIQLQTGDPNIVIYWIAD